MSDSQVNLNNCSAEPIHIPGQIQSHGFLVVIDEQFIVQFCSENIDQFLNTSAAELVLKPLTFLEKTISHSGQPGFITDVINFGIAKNNFDQSNPFEFNIEGVPYYLITSRNDGFYLLEFEPVVINDPMDIQKVISHTLFEILGYRDLTALLNTAAVEVKDLIHYDRVMIYRFAEDGHGEVVAEAKDDDMPSWLGLHYPASDIPKQARELYKLNLTRLIADVSVPTTKILAANVELAPLNLTHSQLRAVSPIHIQYLKNMGVTSSFSISLIYKNELWGLIACHHKNNKAIDYRARQSARLIGQILSSALTHRQDDQNLQQYETFVNNSKQLFTQLKESNNIPQALTGHEINILNVVDATGAVLVYDQKTICVGATPSEEQLVGLIHWIEENATDHLYSTSSISSAYPKAWAFKEIASGLLVCLLSKEYKEYIIWFKPELLQTTNWAGNPNIPYEYKKDELLQISPRHSFEVWSQTVTGTSKNWSKEELSSVLHLKQEINYMISAKAIALRSLNDKLEQAYEELDAFSYTISHDLKNPLAVIKSFAQLLERDKTLSIRGQDFVARIADRADKMNHMIGEVLNYSRMGRLDLDYKNVDVAKKVKDIIADLRLLFTSPELQITTGLMPELQGDKTMIMQVFSNLISNAVKYSQDANPPFIHIEGVINDHEVCYRVRDNGHGIPKKDHAKLFQLFNRLENAKEIEGSGVGLAIVKRIMDKHKGRIWVESETNMGSTFYVAFQRKEIVS